MLIRPNIVPNIKDNIQSDLDRNLLGTYSDGAQITTTKVGTFSMTLRGYAGTIKVNWGDGSPPEIVTLLGTSTNVVVDHTYVLAGSKQITIYTNIYFVTYFLCTSDNLYGDISGLSYFININYINVRNNSCTFLGATFTSLTIGPFWFRSAFYLAESVGKILIAFAAGGMHDCTLYLDGTNPAPPSDQDVLDAITTLIGNNVVLYVNT